MNNNRSNKQVVTDLIERVWRQGRLEELHAFWTADCFNHADPAPQKQGLAALTAYHAGFVKWFSDFEDIRIDVERQIAENELVTTQILTRAVHKVSRRSIQLATIRIDRLIAGRICEHWSIADMAGLLQQLA